MTKTDHEIVNLMHNVKKTIVNHDKAISLHSKGVVHSMTAIEQIHITIRRLQWMVAILFGSNFFLFGYLILRGI